MDGTINPSIGWEIDMCTVCTDYFKGSLTFKEAMRNMGEISITANDVQMEHLREAEQKLFEEELKKTLEELTKKD